MVINIDGNSSAADLELFRQSILDARADYEAMLAAKGYTKTAAGWKFTGKPAAAGRSTALAAKAPARPSEPEPSWLPAARTLASFGTLAGRYKRLFDDHTALEDGASFRRQIEYDLAKRQADGLRRFLSGAE